MNIDKLSRNIFFKETLDKYQNNVFKMILNELNFIDDEKINISKNMLKEFFNELCFDERCEIIEKFYINFKDLLNDNDFVKNLNFSELEVNQYKILIKNREIKLELDERTNILYDVLNQVSDLIRKNYILNEEIREFKNFKDMYESDDRHTLKYCKDYVDEHKDF